MTLDPNQLAQEIVANYGNGKFVQGPSTDTGTFTRNTIETVMAATFGSDSVVAELLKFVEDSGVVTALGEQLAAGLETGTSLGAGIYFAPEDLEFGIYGSVSQDVGWIASISGSIQVEFVETGGLAAFSGQSYAITVAGGEEMSGSMSILFGAQGGYIGFAGTIGISVGSLFSSYISDVHTKIAPIVKLAASQANTIISSDIQGGLSTLAAIPRAGGWGRNRHRLPGRRRPRRGRPGLG